MEVCPGVQWCSRGVGFNDAALKDLFNYALDKPLNWWRMRGLDHLTFGGFLEFLVRPPAKEAAAPQVTADATAPPVVVDVAATPPEVPAEEAAASPVVADDAAAPPVAADKAAEAAAPPVVADKAVAPRSRRRRWNRRKASSTLQGLEAVPEPAPVRESAPVQEPTELEPCKPAGTRRGPTR